MTIDIRGAIWRAPSIIYDLTEYYYFRVHAFYHVLQGTFSLYALILLWQKTVVNLHAVHKKTDSRAAHDALLACFLLLCITQIIS